MPDWISQGLSDGPRPLTPEWPGVGDHEHGEPYDADSFYDSPVWCRSCGGAHGRTYIGCNGLRDDETRRCNAILGEAWCNRPLHHLGEHVADSDLMRVEWRVKSGPSTTRDEDDPVNVVVGPLGTDESATVEGER